MPKDGFLPGSLKVGGFTMALAGVIHRLATRPSSVDRLAHCARSALYNNGGGRRLIAKLILTIRLDHFDEVGLSRGAAPCRTWGD